MTAVPDRSHPPLRQPGAGGFIWAAGIEDTFITAPHRRTGRTLDEYELTEHYSRWAADVRLLAELGVSAARYGIPWHRVNPRPGTFDWSWTDSVLDTMVNAHRIEPIIDLVHYGAPLWLEDAFLNQDYPHYVAEYAHAFAERYRSLCYWYTPLNEPRINAWYCGRIGWWPPYGASWLSFAQVLVNISRGICLTQRAIRSVEPASVFVHVDATDLYLPDVPDDEALRTEAAFRQELVFLALDLVMGRVSGDHALYRWLSSHQFADADLAWFVEHAVQPAVIGLNMYPMFSRKYVARTRNGGMRVRIRRCWSETLDVLLELYARRYSPLPIMITETAADGSYRRRCAWIEDSVRVVRKARESGLPIVGYTYWPLYSLVTWAYRQGTGDPSRYLLDMGLWDLCPGPTGLERLHTPVADCYRQLVGSVEFGG